ncbi:cell division protein SepF [Halobellus sp. GM3]|uniref:cell division protein SepF n=1 Tax=Halobellus sp. GM3 TaxID=3458410 RepID=UPI00403E2260
MGIMSKIISGGGQHTTDEYLDLDIDLGDVEGSRGEAGMNVRIATISGQQDVIDIKDAVYDGDLVIADITRHTTSDSTMEHIVDDLRQVAEEVDGDIAQKDDDQIIIAPTGVAVARRKLN